MGTIIARRDASSTSYDVFLSYRGEDTRKGFTDHLYMALQQAGIHTFRDHDEIQGGANIAAEIHKAIQESRVCVIVFSKDYASSTWCLEELVKIMDRRKLDDELMVIPVFYGVDPSHVRRLTGSFAQAFSRHEERFQKEMEKVDRWRQALRDVADFRGMVLGDRYESQFIQNIVQEIGNKLDHTTSYVGPYVVGIDHRVRGINMWLKDGSKDVGVAVIFGMGGIGKTTIAKAAYDQNFHRFEASSFLPDVRAASEQPNGFLFLQRKLVSDIQNSTGKPKKIYSIDEGLSKIKIMVHCKRVLVVLDDVNHHEQFNAILGTQEWFHPGSKIIITTRQEGLFSDHHEVFKVEGLGEYDSLQLFSWYAFKRAHPTEGYMELSRSVVKQCEGLPLALQILGSSLFGKSVDLWRSALQKLEMIPDDKILKILRISFDTLKDDHDRNLFLHIVFFFVGKKMGYIITILDNLGFCTRIGIQNLVDRCLVEIENDKKLVMHQLLRDMGREIVRQESCEDPGKRSRLSHNDASDILRKLTGTKTIKGLMLNLPSTIRSNKRRCHDEDYSDGNCSRRRRRLEQFSWVPSNIISSTNFVAAAAALDSKVDFKAEAFRRMRNLELLLLDNVNVGGGYDHFPKNLIWLCWRGFCFKSMPENFYLENLVGLDLQNSSLQHVWNGTKFLPRLKSLNLGHSHSLVTTPDFSGFPSLEKLILKDCIKLVEVDESVGNLEKLIVLNLKGCKSLTKLPTRICMLTSLQKLDLSGCSNLVLDHAKKLDMVSSKIWQAIWSWRSWVTQRNNELQSACRFMSMNQNLLPHCLGSLSLVDCNLQEVPGDLSFMSLLKHLNLSRNPIRSLPENMAKGLIMLQTLEIHGCEELKTLPKLPRSLRKLEASYCSSLERITNLPNMFESLDSSLWKCKKLVRVESLFSMKPLRMIDLEMMNDMGLLMNIERTTEVQMINYLTCTTTKGPVQGLFECGIFSIFVPGNNIPDWFTYKSMGNSVLSIIPPSHLNRKIRGLVACVRYSRRPFWLSGINFLKISNPTKGLHWTYCPVAAGLPEKNQDMLWLSHWMFENDELEEGEEVRVSINDEFSGSVKEFGVQLVYCDNNKDVAIQQETPSSSREIVLAENVSSSASKYLFWTGRYFLCNHRARIHQRQFSRRTQMNHAYVENSCEPETSGFRYLFDQDYVHVRGLKQDEPTQRTINMIQVNAAQPDPSTIINRPCPNLLDCHKWVGPA